MNQTIAIAVTHAAGARARKLARALPARAPLVQRIARATREGRFNVNAEAIADKLIANAQELLGHRGQ
jgi:negative regulator of flagellin synthesis FlgM